MAGNGSHGAQGARQVWVSEEIHAAIAKQAFHNHRKMRMETEVVLCKALGYADLTSLNKVFTAEHIQELKDEGIIKVGRSPKEGDETS